MEACFESTLQVPHNSFSSVEVLDGGIVHELTAVIDSNGDVWSSPGREIKETTNNLGIFSCISRVIVVVLVVCLGTDFDWCADRVAIMHTKFFKNVFRVSLLRQE